MEADKEGGSEIEMDVQTQSPMEEKALPPPPTEVTWSAAALPAPLQESNLALTPSPAPGPPRLKKKLPWKGKNIMVLLPWDDERGQKGNAPTPMTEKDVEAMLRDWEQLGYDTSGFNLGQTVTDDHEGGEGQSRSLWPTTQDVIFERHQKSFRVSIPDKRGWFSFSLQLVVYAYIGCQSCHDKRTLSKSPLPIKGERGSIALLLFV